MGFINAEMTVEDKTDVIQVYVCEFTKKRLLGRDAMTKLQVTPDLLKMKVNAVARTSNNLGTQQRLDMLLLGRKIRTNLPAPACNPEDEEADKRREEYQEPYRKEAKNKCSKSASMPSSGKRWEYSKAVLVGHSHTRSLGKLVQPTSDSAVESRSMRDG